MRLMKIFLFTIIAMVGLSVAVSAQKKPDNPPPKNPPPVVKPGPQKPPQKPEKPQKPAYAFVESVVISRNDLA